MKVQAKRPFMLIALLFVLYSLDLLAAERTADQPAAEHTAPTTIATQPHSYQQHNVFDERSSDCCYSFQETGHCCEGCSTTSCLTRTAACVVCPLAVPYSGVMGAIRGLVGCGGIKNASLISNKLCGQCGTKKKSDWSSEHVCGNEAENYITDHCWPCLCVAGTVESIASEAYWNARATTLFLTRVIVNHPYQEAMIRGWMHSRDDRGRFKWDKIKTFIDHCLS